MDGLDDFQKVHGFIRGMDKEYQDKVKTQYPKTLEEVIKSALNFDDVLDKRANKSSSGYKANKSSSSFGKRKFGISSTESPKTNKKAKGGPLSSKF